MAKVNYLGQIRQRLESLRKEFAALTEAHQILSAVEAGRGRKAKLPSLDAMVNESRPGKKSGRKRGRPAGARNKPGSKKPGPKPTTEKVVKSGKRGRPSSKSAAKGAAKPVTSKSIAPQNGKKKSASVKASGKRTRIPDLSVKIQEFIGKTGRFVTNGQITDKLVTLYPGKTRSDLGKYISVILANMKSRKELGVVTIDSKGNKMRSGLWGLTSWFENGKPKADYLK